MIPISKPSSAPSVLNTKGTEATQEFCDDHERGERAFAFNSKIYGDKTVKLALIKAQNGKCAFCESKISHISPGDVEHFRPKAGYKQKNSDKKLRQPGYYWLAYNWDNLFFACQKCNQSFKKNHFPLRNDRNRAKSHKHSLDKERPLLIDPSKYDPTSFIGFREEVAYPIGGCREGLTTIEVLGINRSGLEEIRRDRLVRLKRLAQLFHLLLEKATNEPNKTNIDQLEGLRQLLLDSISSSGEYSSMARAFLEGMLEVLHGESEPPG